MIEVFRRNRRWTLALLAGIVSTACVSRAASAADVPHRAPPATGDVAGTVTDSASGAPIQGVSITLLRGTSVVASVVTDPFGKYRVHQVATGPYTLTTR